MHPCYRINEFPCDESENYNSLPLIYKSKSVIIYVKEWSF